MTIANIFELASKKKFRFDSPKGALTVENLWDIPLTGQFGTANLDDVAKALFAQVKEAESSVSFVKPAEKADPSLEAKFELVKYIIEVRVAERDAAAQERQRAEQKQRIMELIDRKKDQNLEGQSIEELQAMLAKI